MSRPSSGCCHLISASTASTAWVAASTWGWYQMTSSPSRMPRLRSSVRRSRWWMTRSCATSYSAHPTRVDLAWYMATSARRKRSVEVSPRMPSATPREADTVTVSPRISTGSSRTPVTTRPSSMASIGSSVNATRANSSPPSRATARRGLSRACSRCATSTNTWSPTVCPRLSLMSLKPSRSSSISASRRSSPNCRSRSARTARRLGRPVSSSVRDNRRASAAPWASCNASASRPPAASNVTRAVAVTHQPIGPSGPMVKAVTATPAARTRLRARRR